jgi:CO/xanthine dehydrogenase FAD-binding subunit
VQELFRPRDLSEALAILAARSEVRPAAGCTDLFPATAAPALQGAHIDLTALEELSGISRTPEGFRVGAATTWREAIEADLPPAFEMLKEAAREVGSPQIQNAGTIGGNLCNASPAADGVPCLLALDAQVELASAEGRRMLPLGKFITGPRQTALGPGELLVAVHVPGEAARGASRFLKLGARRYLVISIAMVAVRLVVEEGRVASAAVAVGACSPVARRLEAVEAALVGAEATPALAARVRAADVAAALSPIDDVRADAGYRLEAAAVLVRRAVSELVTHAGECAA